MLLTNSSRTIDAYAVKILYIESDKDVESTSPKKAQFISRDRAFQVADTRHDLKQKLDLLDCPSV